MSKVDDKKTVLIYAGHDLVDLIMLNRVVPEMIDMGLTAEIVFPRKPKLKSPGLDNPVVQEYGFYHSTLLQNYIIPYLDEYGETYGVDLNQDGTPRREDTVYTPNQLAKLYGLKVTTLDKVNNANHVKRVNEDKSLAGALSLRCMQYFKQPLIDAVRKNGGFFYNAHPGKLEDYRGVIPVFRAMLNEDVNLQWTLHSIVDEGVDTGPIHDSTSQRTNWKKSVFWHYQESANNVAAMVAGIVRDTISGKKIRTYDQKLDEGAHYSYPEQELTDQFNSMSGKFIEPKGKMRDMIVSIMLPNGSKAKHDLGAFIAGAVDHGYDNPGTPPQSNSFNVWFKGAPKPMQTQLRELVENRLSQLAALSQMGGREYKMMTSTRN